MSKLITCPVDYVCGHLRYGHYELKLTDEEFAEFQQLSDDDKASRLVEGNFIVDSYEIDDIGDLRGRIGVSNIDD